MKSSGGFGQPKPLPGQTGYGEKVVDVLEKETNEMEARLQVLQERLRAQQMMDTDAKNNSGPKWKSSKVEKGSIRSYGKEVSEKAKKKTLELSTGASLMSRSSTLPLRSGGSAAYPLMETTPIPSISFSSEENNQSSLSKDVTDWTIDDVSDWLTNLGVPQYAEAFASNEMMGSMLLDITLEDLDYMNVKVLAHRKLILRAIEDLRQRSSTHKANRAPSALLRASSRGSARQSTVISEPVQVESEVAPPKAVPAKVHWSQLEPMSSKEPISGNRAPPVNAADDVIDEEAERLAFQQAVEEWRRGSSNSTQKGKVVTVRDFSRPDSSSNSSTAAAAADFSDRQGEWVNPFSLPSAPSPRTVGGSLKAGALDEEAEHAEFVKAVEEWRNAKKNSNQASHDSMSIETPRSISVGGQSTISNARQLADALATNLDKEKEEMFRNLQKRREQAEQKLQEAAKELEVVRQTKIQNAKPPSAPGVYEQDSTGDGQFSTGVFGRSESKHSNAKIDSSQSKSVVNPDVYVPNDIEFDDEDDHDNDDHLTTSVRIELVDSIIGSTAATSEGAECIVEYASDSD